MNHDQENEAWLLQPWEPGARAFMVRLLLIVAAVNAVIVTVTLIRVAGRAPASNSGARQGGRDSGHGGIVPESVPHQWRGIAAIAAGTGARLRIHVSLPLLNLVHFLVCLKVQRAATLRTRWLVCSQIWFRRGRWAVPGKRLCACSANRTGSRCECQNHRCLC